MPRTSLSIMQSLTAAVASALAIGSTTALADPPCSNASLAGTFYYTVAQIHVTPTGPDYCDEYGTAVADGAGNLRTTSTRRCSISAPTPVPDTGTNTYTVSPDCSIAIKEVPGGQITHGKVLMRGDMVLVDGTTRTDSSKLQHAVAVRISKDKKLPPTTAPATRK